MRWHNHTVIKINKYGIHGLSPTSAFLVVMHTMQNSVFLIVINICITQFTNLTIRIHATTEISVAIKIIGSLFLPLCVV